MCRRPYVIVLIALIAGCSYLEPEPSTTTTTTLAGTETVVATTTTTLPGDSPCLAGDRPFASDGLISAFGGADGDATQISGIRWANYPGCEQVIVDFLTADGAPAGSLDPVGVEYDAPTGVVRVSLPADINRSAIADSLVDGDLVKRAYVVATSTNLAIDVHLAAGRSYALRAREVDSPSRIVIDIKEDPDAQPVLGATTGGSVVVVSPPAGPVTSPLLVTGYVKGSYQTVTADLLGRDDQTVAVTGSASPVPDDGLWREFAETFHDVPAMPLELVVTPDDHSDQAVRVSIDATPLNVSEPAQQ
jgi:hypothetical protein